MQGEKNKSNQLISEKIFDEIKKRIIFHEYTPGEVLNERRLMKEFSVSRTPIREALIRLEMQEFVVIMPRTATMVSQINYKELKNIFEIRIALEPMGARLVAERIKDEQIASLRRLFSHFCPTELTQNEVIRMDIELHRIIYQAMDNELLANILSRLHEHCLRLLKYVMTQKSYIRIALKDVDNLINAFAKRDANLAEKLMKQHFLNYLEKIKDELSSNATA